MDSSDDDYIEEERVNVRSRTRRTKKDGDSKSNDQKEQTGYSWEDEYQRSWDVVQEDSGGSLATAIAGMVEDTRKRRVVQDTRPLQRGIIRNLVLMLDMSSIMNDTDMRPTRLAHVLGVASEFVTEFFSQNPISQLAIVGLRDGLAQLISPLDGNPELHRQKLQACRKLNGSGAPSLQNGLELARACLLHVPQHNTREVLVIYGSLMSSDSGSIQQCVAQLVQDRIRVHIIGLAAQVAICQYIARTTNFGDLNTYNVVLNEQHFKQLTMDVTVPMMISESSAKASSVPVRMGFPSRTSAKNAAPTLCSCHVRPTTSGFICPQCSSKVCTLPMSCPVCSLTLILSTHLARSYHHLFPLANFDTIEDAEEKRNCYACLMPLQSTRYSCPHCKQQFCLECDMFCHESLHNCPGCETMPS